MKKKYIIFAILGLLSFSITVYALNSNFNFDSSKLTFAANSKSNTIADSFNKEYKLTKQIDNQNEKLEQEIKDLSKKTTYLLLGEMNNQTESNEQFYKRRNEFYANAAYNFFPKVNKSEDEITYDYDPSIPNYQYARVSEFAIPQMFLMLDELDINYNSYGDIRVTVSDNLVISAVSLPNVKMKEQNKDNPMKYDIVTRNLVLYYYFLEIDNEYRLCYLYGDYTDELDKYIGQVEGVEAKAAQAVSTSYESNLSSIYSFDKLKNVSEDQFNNIYNSNEKNIVYLSAYYNNQNTQNANGFFINDGLVVTTWDFLEKSLKNSQYIVVSDKNNTNYEIDGIVTVNPDTNIAIIKLKEKNGSYVNLGDQKQLKVEDPAITISSKSGVGLVMQKGILLSTQGYIQTSIPLSVSDEGSPLFDANGNVVGINTAKSTSTSISMAIGTEVLKEIQDKFNSIDFNSIETIKFEKLKEQYYVKYNNENVTKNIPKRKWKEYSKIGNVEKTIKLELVKSSYKDGIVSLRYKNEISNYISNMHMAAGFKEELVKQGFKETLNTSSKCIYTNNKYQVIIMDEFDSLVIVVVKL